MGIFSHDLLTNFPSVRGATVLRAKFRIAFICDLTSDE